MKLLAPYFLDSYKTIDLVNHFTFQNLKVLASNSLKHNNSILY